MSTKVESSVPEPTENELALQSKQLELAEFQLTELRRQSDLQQEFAAGVQPLLEQQASDAEFARAEAERLAPIQEELLNLALDDLRQGGAATPEQIGLIEEAGDAALARGETDINRFQSEGLERLGEFAAASGLRPGDTPILDRAGRLGAEAQRQQGQLAQGIRGAEATARLNFPLAQSQLTQASSLGLSQLQEATRQFQDGLRQQAFSNRLGLQSQVGGLGLGLATGVPFNVNQGLGTLQLNRFAQASQTTSGLGQFLQPLAGGLSSGLTAFALTKSSRDFKTDKAPIDEEEVLKRVEKLPVESWRYKDGLGLGEERHVGTYAEDFRETLGLGDGKTIPVVDGIGIAMAAIKGLSKKVKRLERAGLGLAEPHRKRGGLGLAVAA